MVTNKKKNQLLLVQKKDNIEALGDNVLKRLGDLNDDALNEHFKLGKACFLQCSPAADARIASIAPIARQLVRLSEIVQKDDRRRPIYYGTWTWPSGVGVLRRSRRW